MTQASTEGKMDLSQVPFEPYYRDEHCVIYNADCRKVLPFLPKFDLLLTDPAYGIGYGGKRNSVGGTEGRAKNGWKTWKTDWDEERPADWQLKALLDSADNAIIWGGNYFADCLPPSQGWLIWDKGQRDFTLADAELAWTSFDRAIRAFDYARGKFQADETRIHATQKPLALFRWCMALVPEAKTVLDCYAGSLTTAVAAKVDGRFSVCIELGEENCEKGVKRLEQGVLF